MPPLSNNIVFRAAKFRTFFTRVTFQAALQAKPRTNQTKTGSVRKLLTEVGFRQPAALMTKIIAPCIGNRKRSDEYGDSGIKSTLDTSRLLPIDLQIKACDARPIRRPTPMDLRRHLAHLYSQFQLLSTRAVTPEAPGPQKRAAVAISKVAWQARPSSRNLIDA
jgi:hypothetical protein